MASSLEDLLQEDGFKGRRSRMKGRSSFKAETGSRLGEQCKIISTSGSRIRTERTSSDAYRYSSRGESSRSNDGTSRKPQGYVASRLQNEGRKDEANWDRPHTRSSKIQHDQTLHTRSSKDSDRTEIIEIGKEEDGIRDIYSDKEYRFDRRDGLSSGHSDVEEYQERTKKEPKLGPRGGNSRKDLTKNASTSRGNRNTSKLAENNHRNSLLGQKDSKTHGDDGRRRPENIPPQVPTFALDEVAVKAMISILNGYTKRFFKDEEFRNMVRYNSFSSFNFNEIEEIESIEKKVISSLEEAIYTVEEAAKENVSAKDLKKAALQLSVITGLNSNELKDGYTFGVPNSRLSACAQFYLSAVYKLQKKDRVSAKHLLQVFCDSPFWARTILLPDLWDYLLFPHLSHLKLWYNQEAESLPDTPSKIRKVKLLEKVYNETLDSGTYQFAAYYKDWLTEGLEAPSLPSIHIPSLSNRSLSQESSKDHSSGLGSPSSPYSPRPTVSKKLYDAVFSHSSKLGIQGDEENGDAGNSRNSARSSDDSGVQVKETLTFSSETGNRSDERVEIGKDGASLHVRELSSTSEELWKLVEIRDEPEAHSNGGKFSCQEWQAAIQDTPILATSPQTKSNELTLKGLTKSAFGQQSFKGSSDLTVYSLPHNIKVLSPRAAYGELAGDYEYFEEGSFYASIPQDFMCPLTGELFEDPVTLETGQTFEREAIADWFNLGNRSCPVTGKALECSNLPLTNLILKRVIQNWKLEHCGQLLALASQIIRTSRDYEARQRDETAIFILEKLLTTFSVDERIKNAIHLVCLESLEFLSRRFAQGNIEEKTRVALLLSCCIEADEDCRSLIARNVDKQGLLELLHSKDPNSRQNAVSLMTELVCLSRRRDVTLFFRDVDNEKITGVMHVLLLYLQSSPPEQKPSVAVLLLHLDLLAEPQKYSIYREEAVDAIVTALECSIIDDRVRETTCKALLLLGGCFSATGKTLIESLILKQAGLANTSEANPQEEIYFDDSISQEEEDEAGVEWLRNLSRLLLRNRNKSFLELVSQCLSSGKSDLVSACLTTIVWLSCAISSQPGAEFQLSGVSPLISGLKESLEHEKQVEHKVLASMSLLNFSRIPECRVMLITIAKDIADPLQSLFCETWTAKQLHDIIICDRRVLEQGEDEDSFSMS
ncbi:Putative E3 ubiquitin-protein ligase LIN-1 [Linum perenne]